MPPRPIGATAISPPLPPSAWISASTPSSASCSSAPPIRTRAHNSCAAAARMKTSPEAGRAYRSGTIVGVGAGADQRRIADPPPALGGQSRRSRWPRRHGRCTSTATAPIVPYLMSASNASPPWASSSSNWRRRSGVTNQRLGTCSSPCLAGEIVRPFITHQHVRALLHHRAGGADRCAGRAKPGDRAAASRRRPSMIAASSSTWPSKASTLPRPALKQGSSSRIRAAASTASSALPPVSQDRFARIERGIEARHGPPRPARPQARRAASIPTRHGSPVSSSSIGPSPAADPIPVGQPQ